MAFDDLIKLKMISLLFFGCVEIIEKMRMNVGGIRLVRIFFFLEVGVSVDLLIHHHHQSSESDLMMSCGPRPTHGEVRRVAAIIQWAFSAHLKGKIEKIVERPSGTVRSTADDRP